MMMMNKYSPPLGTTHFHAEPVRQPAGSVSSRVDGQWLYGAAGRRQIVEMMDDCVYFRYVCLCVWGGHQQLQFAVNYPARRWVKMQRFVNKTVYGCATCTKCRNIYAVEFLYEERPREMTHFYLER